MELFQSIFYNKNIFKIFSVKPYAETIDIDDVFENFHQNLKNIKDLSIFLMSAGNIDLMVSPLFKSFDRSLDRCNIYFVW